MSSFLSLLAARPPLSSSAPRILLRSRVPVSPPRPAISRSIPALSTPRKPFRCPHQPLPQRQQRWYARIPPERHTPHNPNRNQDYIDTYAHRVTNNEHYVRLQAAKPLPTPSGLSMTAVAAIAVVSACIFYFYNLETVPISGRTRFNFYSSDAVNKVGEQEYKRLLASLEDQGTRVLPDWDPRTARVKRVMQKLIPFSGMAVNDWEIYVIESPSQANAFVLPGGKVFVFSGILNLARNDSQLATVLGHEIAHNVAEHVAERLSASFGTNILIYSAVILGGVFGLGPLLMWFVGPWATEVAFGFPMSRKQESEADYIGLMIMAQACYDPREAVDFWARMERAGKASGQEEVPEWASTHPTNLNRIKKIQEWMPEAMDKWSQSDCSTTTSFADLFRMALERGQVIIV
ncbi:mitochondrial metalloendopeptidase OMA1 [Podospora australis]|uniref:Mitochondrial metalloendopeptidase OMA1 n=1 Tax=Podospora australis TaxID=1536484 RepID=A0AAN6X386_9PEZI|nr:mitochondrial metalloendopeptidase OMA1 [Podospora australis]